MASIFLSYSREDHACAHRLAHHSSGGRAASARSAVPAAGKSHRPAGLLAQQDTARFLRRQIPRVRLQGVATTPLKETRTQKAQFERSELHAREQRTFAFVASARVMGRPRFNTLISSALSNLCYSTRYKGSGAAWRTFSFPMRGPMKRSLAESRRCSGRAASRSGLMPI